MRKLIAVGIVVAALVGCFVWYFTVRQLSTANLALYKPALSIKYPNEFMDAGITMLPDNRSMIVLTEPARAKQSFDYTANVIDLSTGKTLRKYAHAGPGGRVSPDGRYYFSLGKSGLVKCDLKTGAESALFRSAGYLESVSKDRRFFLVREDAHMNVYDATTGKRIRQFGKANMAWAGAISPDGRHVALACTYPRIGPMRDTTPHPVWVEIYDVATGEMPQMLDLGMGAEPKVAYSLDGKSLVVGADRMPVSVYDTNTWQLTRKLAVDDYDQLQSIAFWTGDVLEVKGNTTKPGSACELWSLRSGKKLLERPSFEMATSSDGRMALTYEAGNNNEAVVSDVAADRPLYRLGSPRGIWYCPRFSHDGRYLATISDTGSVPPVVPGYHTDSGPVIPAKLEIWRLPAAAH